MAGQTVANAAVVPLGTGGGITVIAGVSGTDLILDTNGYYDNSGVITSITAGTGLTAGGTSGNVSLGIANGGVGTAQLSATGSSNGQALVSNGSSVNWGSPASFTGTLAGEVTGTQGATVVSNAVPANTPNAIVRRDGSGNFSAQTATLGGNLALTATGGSTTGVITSGVDPFLHNFGTFNTFLGLNAGNFTMTGFDNTASGAGALNSNTTGVDNTASGFNALRNNTTGSANAASGTSALVANTTGSSNTAMGRSALENNTTGNNNTATGVVALFNNISGTENTAIGLNALFRNTTGIGNTASGVFALDRNTSGNANTASGGNALFFNTTGGFNTASGYQALFNNATGSSNIAIGYGAGLNLTTGDNNIDIGNAGQGVPPDANTIRIGTVGTHTATFIAGIFTAMVPGGSPVVVNMSGQLGLIPSARRFKEEIEDMGDGSNALMKLRPVTFRYKREMDPTGSRQYGLIADEVEEVLPELVAYGRDGQVETVLYHEMPAMLLNELQKQQRRIEEQSGEIALLKAELASLKGAFLRRVETP